MTMKRIARPLRINAAPVEDEGDPVFQDTHRGRMRRKRPYEEPLKNIQVQLGE